MKKTSQKDAVFSIILNTLGEFYSNKKPMREYFCHTEEWTDFKYTSEGRKRLNKAVDQFIFKVGSGEIEMPKGHNLMAQEKLKAYARNIIFNWLKKDSRLNGGKKYTPRRSDSCNYDLILKCLGDKQVQELFSLLRSLPNNKKSPHHNLVKDTLIQRVHELEGDIESEEAA